MYQAALKAAGSENVHFVSKATEAGAVFDDHVGFEAAAWYWHFVDVVWLFLFVCIYWYGAGSIAPE